MASLAWGYIAEILLGSMSSRWNSARLDRQRGNFYSRAALLSIENSPGGDGKREGGKKWSTVESLTRRLRAGLPL
jgi:hypothetical protein